MVSASGFQPEGTLRGRAGQAAAVWRRLDQSNKKNDGVLPYTKYVNRPLARPVVVLSYIVGATPNQLTFLSAAIALAALAGVFLGADSATLASGGAVTAALLFAYVLDSADGRLSRVLGTSSRAGEWLDHTLDSAKLGITHAACYFVAARSDILGPRALALLVATILGTAVAAYFGNMMRDQMLKASYTPPASRSVRMVREIAFVPFDYGIFCFLFVTMYDPDLFASLYLAWGAMYLLRTALSFRRTFAALAALPAKGAK